MKKRFREMRGVLTQKQMVKIINKELEASGSAGITVATWSRWETGANEPSKAMYKWLSNFFGVSIAYLKGITDTQMSFEQLADEYDLLLADYHELSLIHHADLEEIRTLKHQLNFYRAKFDSKENQKGYAEINIPNDLKFDSKQDAIDCIEKIMKALDISKEDLRTEH